MPTFKEIIKGFFKTNDHPTQSQFGQFMDKIFFKDELIPTSSIVGLNDILNTLPQPKQILNINTDGSVEIGNDCEVYKITFESDEASQTIGYGKNLSGDDIEPGVLVMGGVKQRCEQTFSMMAGERIYFSGLEGMTKITIYKD